jgi:uncharacterized protein YgiB involved in biofilm formation
MLRTEHLKSRPKRSSQVGLTVMASRLGGVIGGAALLAGCGSDPAAPSAQAEEAGPKLEVQAYENVFECAANSGMTQQECSAAREQAVADAAKTAPRFAASYDCEAEWGQGNCVPQKAEGQSFFMPFVGGFLLGKMLQGSVKLCRCFARTAMVRFRPPMASDWASTADPVSIWPPPAPLKSRLLFPRSRQPRLPRPEAD